jgi:4-alpha-glucanotransferase
MRLPRSSGILLHPTSLPGRFGIGDLGPAAYEFLDFLTDTGQRWWQILPLGPTGYGNSPYQSYSSFAGNPMLISPERLADEGLLSPSDWARFPRLDDDRVDFDAVIAAKDELFRKAFERFGRGDAGFRAFVKANAGWLDDFSLFMALKEAHGGRAWCDWGAPHVRRDPGALKKSREKLAGSVRYYQFLQYAFARQWGALREACRARNVGMIGDLPIYVAQDCADVWSRPDLFQLDTAGKPTAVAGVPPDYFSATGQLWGNPLYRWEAHRDEGFAWWLDRLKAQLSRVDLVRLDHFRGFEAYWEVPAGAETAVGGCWRLGPGAEFLEAVRTGLGGLPIVAEDLGDITPEVLSLRDRFGLPGMRVLQFGFQGSPGTELHLPFSFVNNCLAYTGTHDNDTTVGWFETLARDGAVDRRYRKAQIAYAHEVVGSDGEEIHWDVIRAALGSVADTVIVPLQDVLGLGSDARMNTPGVGEGNWCWRFRRNQLRAGDRARLARLTAAFHRWNGKPPAPYGPPRAAGKIEAQDLVRNNGVFVRPGRKRPSAVKKST